MDKQKIITEGYLEAYITGDLDASEMREVETLIASDKEARGEYFKIEKLVELLAFHGKKAPSPVVKRMVMENESVMNNHTDHGSSAGSGWKLMMAASVFVAALSLLTAFYFYNQWRTTDYELSNLIAQNLELANNYNQVNNDLDNLRQDVAVLISPEYQRVILAGTDNSPDANAVIYWNSKQEKVFLNSASMAALPGDQQYQLWALVDGLPIDAGVFDAATGTFQIMKNIGQADAFAVTIEPKGGSEAPTLSTMQVLGTV
ncbi:MAG: anti-sigma factor [Cyclobacteriaceae bacterium]